MEGYEEEKEKAKQETDVKTFIVPFALENINEKITILTNKLSKEQIVNQALKFHSEDNISEAIKYYNYFINKGYKDYRVFSNYGDILKNLRKSKEAENSYRKAIELNPNMVDVHLKMGKLLIENGKLVEALAYTKKAIQLNPDYLEAYNYLGATLMYLGKPGEANIVFRSMLKSKKIKPDYQVRAYIKMTISYIIQGDFKKTINYMNTVKELINSGALNEIKNKNKKLQIYIFAKFINSFYLQLEEPKSKLLEKVNHIGESHCLTFAHQSLLIFSNKIHIQPLFIGGGKAWHFANNNNNQWKDSLTQQIKNQNQSNKVFISFGEIDCRKNEGILTYTIKKGKNISEVCKETIIGYLNYMESTLSVVYSERYYFGVPAPEKTKDLPDELDIKRVEMIKIYNSILKKEVLSRGCYFVDVYGLTSSKNGLNNNIHMCDGTHLSPKCLSTLFENHLYDPNF